MYIDQRQSSPGEKQMANGNPFEFTDTEYQYHVRAYTKRGRVLLTSPYFFTRDMATEFAFNVGLCQMATMHHVAVLDRQHIVVSSYNCKEIA
jgi:hypothetical protein